MGDRKERQSKKSNFAEQVLEGRAFGEKDAEERKFGKKSGKKNGKKRSICLAGLLLLCYLACGCGKQPVVEETPVAPELEPVWVGKQENVDKAFLENAPALVKVVTRTKEEEAYGSGVLFDVRGDKLIVLTNYHVLVYGESGNLYFTDGTDAPFSLLYGDRERDVAFLEVAASNLTEETLQKIRLVCCLPEDSRVFQKGMELGLLGMGETDWRGTKGTLLDSCWYLDDFGMEMLYLEGDAKPGMSGGAVLDERGYYIGMITGSNGGETAAVPLAIIEEVYEAF